MWFKKQLQNGLCHILVFSLFMLCIQQLSQSFALLDLSQHLVAHHHHIQTEAGPVQTQIQLQHAEHHNDREAPAHPVQHISDTPDLATPVVWSLLLGLLLGLAVCLQRYLPLPIKNCLPDKYLARPPPQPRISAPALLQLKTIVMTI